jgi:guanine deaminase
MKFDLSSAEHFMALAVTKARAGIRTGQTPFGACLVKDGRVLACEHNQVWKRSDITAHAEIVAIRAACHRLRTVDLTGAVLYSTCEPCPMCFAASHWARVSAVIFGAAISDAAACGFNELHISNRRLRQLGHSPVQVIGGVLRKECRELFAAWAKRKGHRVY